MVEFEFEGRMIAMFGWCWGCVGLESGVGGWMFVLLGFWLVLGVGVVVECG